MQVLGRGARAEVVLLDNGHALKRYEPGIPLSWVEQEAAKQRLAVSNGVSAPKVYGAYLLEGHACIEMQCVNAPTLADLRRCGGISADQVADQLCALHAQLSCVKVKPDAALETFKDFLLRRVEAQKVPIHIGQEAKRRLLALPEGDCLVHGDLNITNVMGGTIIDWANAAWGDAQADVCVSLVIHGFHDPETASALYQRMLAVPGFTAEGIEAWRYPIMAARYFDDIPGERAMLDAWFDQNDSR